MGHLRDVQPIVVAISRARLSKVNHILVCFVTLYKALQNITYIIH